MNTSTARSLRAALLIAISVAACGDDDATGPSALDQVIAEMRAATAAFADASAALEAGYINTSFCVKAEAEGLPASEGDMGIHFIHPGYLGLTTQQPPFDGSDAVVDPTRPESLLYEPQADGSLRLVGLEFMVFAEAWHAAGNAGPPSFAGVDFVYMEDDPATAVHEAHGFMPHYEAHVWTERENPRGVFAVFNPAVSCAHAQPPGGA